MASGGALSMNPDDLDPTIREFQRQIAAAYGKFPDFASLPLAERRRIAEEVRAPWRIGGPAMRRTDELRVGERDVRIRIHRPDDTPMLPGLIYIHGGGWTLFSIDSHDRLMREYAARAGIAVIGVDYSLAPEARFPTPAEEIVSVVRWLREEGREFGIDVSRLAMGGDSAGANLTVAANLMLRRDGDAPLDAMLLNYGVFAGSSDGHESYRRYDGDSYNLTAEEMVGFWSGYIRDENDLTDPICHPLIADVSELPPAFFAVAACDVLADENRAFAERLRSAGVPAEVRVYEGATHSFLEAVSISPLAGRALDEAAEWLRARLAPPPVLMIGAGRMGQAFLSGWAGIAEASFLDPGVEACDNARKLSSIAEAADLPRPLTVMIAVKPQMISDVLPQLASLAGPDVLFISIAAGVEIASFQALLGEEARIVRAMPNTPVSVGRGVTAAVAGAGVNSRQRQQAELLLSAVGDLIWLDDEGLLDAVTAVSGSGPAYFFRFAEALAEAGAKAGLDRDSAFRLARATLSGSGAVAAARDASLADLRVEVTSPGGTTAAALAELDSAALDEVVAAVVDAAIARARQLAEENRT
jgi:acetyl esterase